MYSFTEIHAFIPFSLLITQHRKEKALSRACHHFGGACTLDLGFLFAVSSHKRKKITRPHHQNGYSLIPPVTVPYLLLSLGLSVSRIGKVSYTYVPLCFPQTYPCCINCHSVLTVFETSNAG